MSNLRHCGINDSIEIVGFIETDSDVELEKYLHKSLNEFRVINEWFNISDPDIVYCKVSNFIESIKLNDKFDSQSISLYNCEDKYNSMKDYNILFNNNIDVSSKITYSALNELANEMNCVVVAIGTLSDWCGLSETTLKRTINRLEYLGAIVKVRRIRKETKQVLPSAYYIIPYDRGEFDKETFNNIKQYHSLGYIYA